MSVTTEKSAAAPPIRPFTIETSEAELEDLRARIAATRWPEKEPVADISQGPQLATMQALARYWATEYEWRKCEERLKALPHFITGFAHRSGCLDARPRLDQGSPPGVSIGKTPSASSTRRASRSR